MQHVLVSGFGVLGILTRYGIQVLALRYITQPFPYATLAINVVGSFLIGIVYVAGAERAQVGPELRIALMTGLLGGFTTFSALSLEAVQLLEQKQLAAAALYVALSIVLGLGGTSVGLALARSVPLWS